MRSLVNVVVWMELHKNKDVVAVMTHDDESPRNKFNITQQRGLVCQRIQHSPRALQLARRTAGARAQGSLGPAAV
jgi:hypothetical protein